MSFLGRALAKILYIPLRHFYRFLILSKIVPSHPSCCVRSQPCKSASGFLQLRHLFIIRQAAMHDIQPMGRPALTDRSSISRHISPGIYCSPYISFITPHLKSHVLKSPVPKLNTDGRISLSAALDLRRQFSHRANKRRRIARLSPKPALSPAMSNRRASRRTTKLRPLLRPIT